MEHLENAVIKKVCHSRGMLHILSYQKSVILNLIQNLQRLSSSLLNGMRGRSQIKFGMTPIFSTTRGFTLIELLVVVLIIGILAAVALPQYQVMVMKSKISSYIPLLKAIARDNERFYLTNGYYTTNWDDLDVNIPDKFKRGNNNPYFYLSDTEAGFWAGPGIGIGYLHGNGVLPGYFTCNGYGSQLNAKICQSFSTKYVHPWTPHYTYW